MATSQRVKDLVGLLLKRTRDGALKWQTTADENTFRLASRTANVRATKSEVVDPAALTPVELRRLSVTNEFGRVIEEYFPESPLEIDQFDQLFSVARRSASNTDDVLEELMKELEESAP